MESTRASLAPWALILAVGCFVPASTTGFEGENCFPNATCMGSLACEAGMCVVRLRVIVDSAEADPAINTDAFPNTPVEYFWTSVPYAPDPTSAWFVSFSTGTATADKLPNSYHVRCVR